MTFTHTSHFNLEMIATTEQNVLFEGALSACKRMAFAHGMEIERTEGTVAAINGRNAVYNPANESNPNRIWFVNGGMIQRVPGGYVLVMPVQVWANN